ncbi:ABC transporter permease [bacterium BMS3Abin03]|jgi:putative ABC transport system permease protein|nr:ABC transporter permease [bacterium BMS3Abin03]MCG6960114.1 ABC transporter permease [bacterium BMS3Abin03]
MEAKNLLKVALKSILKSRMRSLLTALGIIIGVAAVIVMVAIGNGAQKKVEDQIASLGSNLIVIFPGSINSGGVRMGAGSINRFTMKDVEKIREEATLLKGVTPIVRTGGQVIGGSGNWNTRIEGVSTNYLEISNWSLSSGEFFTEKDMISRAKVAVLGKTVADQLFPNDDPIGQQIRIRNVPFRVIGVLAPKGQNVMGADNDDIIIAPATTVLDRLLGGRYISFIMASASSLSQIDQAQAQLVEIMRKAHNLNPGEDNDFTVRNQAEITQAATETSQVLTILLASVAGVSLIVGGIGIMNIMLVSVTERTREIGIRLSVGARTSDILIQFLTESIALSIAGGLIGVLLAFGITFILNEYTSQAAYINPQIVFIAVSFAGIIGIFFGFYPARKAANLNPIDALRYE